MIKDTGVHEEMIIKEAKELLRNIADEGFVCPCCGQPAKVYRRTITSAMATGLILMYNKFRDRSFVDTPSWLHIESFFKDISGLPPSIRADIPKLRFWHLIEAKNEEKEDGNPCNGYYRLTDLGRAFVENRISVQKVIKIYNNRRIGQVTEKGTLTIKEALKNKFSYDNLMKGEI
jgi:hypothetical protein